MDKNQKKQSSSIIIGMGKKKGKSDLDKALSYYKVSNKTLINQANSLGINVGNMRIKRRDGSVETKKIKPTNEPNSYYANKVREEIIKKWKNDTQEYYGTYNMFYKRYDKKSKKMITTDIVIISCPSFWMLVH
jgi:hypothetical protein